jgi:hypothetical protein
MKRISSLIALSSISILLIVGLAFALGTWDSGYRLSHGTTIDINVGSASGPCHKLTNSHASNDYFVPTRTQAEWDAFLAHLPPGVSVSSCCIPSCACAANTCTGSSCSDGCGGTCTGIKAPSCACAASLCSGTCSDGCGGTCAAAKPWAWYSYYTYNYNQWNTRAYDYWLVSRVAFNGVIICADLYPPNWPSPSSYWPAETTSCVGYDGYTYRKGACGDTRRGMCDVSTHTGFFAIERLECR